MIRNKPRDAVVCGVDLGKNTFHVVGLDATGAPIQRAKFRRETLVQFFGRAKLGACPRNAKFELRTQDIVLRSYNVYCV